MKYDAKFWIQKINPKIWAKRMIEHPCALLLLFNFYLGIYCKFWKLSKDQLYTCIVGVFKSRFVKDEKSNLIHLS